MPPVPNVPECLIDCADWWRAWVSRSRYRGQWEALVKRSLITLKALTFQPGGGMVAAPTTSLPEVSGGSANYDYRFCWLRDAAFALKVLLNEGYTEEAHAWCEWLRKAIEQHDGHLHALYTIDAEVAPEERELQWLPGYQQSKPVRSGNAASHQYQLDVRGELIEVLHLARSYGLMLHDDIWSLQCRILEQLRWRWREPDSGIWEFRTICDHLTHSKVLAWVAYDRSICDAEKYGLYAPLDEWREQREAIRADILLKGIDAKGGYFTQRYGRPEVDASLLMIPLVGFLPADDIRMQATIAKIETELCSAGLVRRYRTGDQANVEGMFIPCSFWLADVYWLAGRHRDAETVFSRLRGLCNDLGLLAEEYDIYTGQQLGNFPQGLSHLALISTARLLATGAKKQAELN
jgi:GH15 family glucan-1,4-alpha-glucosidase